MKEQAQQSPAAQNAYMENLLTIKDSDPARFALFSQSLRWSVEIYAQSRLSPAACSTAAVAVQKEG